MENAGIYKCEAIYIIGEATITKESTTATLYIRGFRNIFLIVYHLCIEKQILNYCMAKHSFSTLAVSLLI